MRPCDADDELDAGIVGEAFCGVALPITRLELAEAEIVLGGVNLAHGHEPVKGEPVARVHLCEAPAVEEDRLDTL